MDMNHSNTTLLPRWIFVIQAPRRTFLGQRYSGKSKLVGFEFEDRRNFEKARFVWMKKNYFRKSQRIEVSYI